MFRNAVTMRDRSVVDTVAMTIIMNAYEAKLPINQINSETLPRGREKLGNGATLPFTLGRSNVIGIHCLTRIYDRHAISQYGFP